MRIKSKAYLLFAVGLFISASLVIHSAIHQYKAEQKNTLAQTKLNLETIPSDLKPTSEARTQPTSKQKDATYLTTAPPAQTTKEIQQRSEAIRISMSLLAKELSANLDSDEKRSEIKRSYRKLTDEYNQLAIQLVKADRAGLQPKNE